VKEEEASEWHATGGWQWKPKETRDRKRQKTRGSMRQPKKDNEEKG
jgi:hypothetical protein